MLTGLFRDRSELIPMTENTTIEFTKAQLSAIEAAQDALEKRVGNRPAKAQAVATCCGRVAANSAAADPPDGRDVVRVAPREDPERERGGSK